MRFTTIAAIVVCAVNASVVAGSNAKDKAKAAPAPPVTVTGCLEHRNAAFRLTETSGKQAPKARNWKTGFITKRNADLEVVEASKRLKLRDHVGHRVSVTGSVKDGEVRAQSMRHIAASCGQ